MPVKLWALPASVFHQLHWETALYTRATTATPPAHQFCHSPVTAVTLSTHVFMGLFCKDTARQQTAENGKQLKQRSALMAQSRRIEHLGPLHCELFFQDKLLQNWVDVKIRLICSKDSIFLMGSLATGACKPLITYGLLFVKRAWVAQGVHLGHSESLHMANTKYLVDLVGMKAFSITGSQPCQ